MALTGKQKAAMLLMSLDAATAAELVRGLDAEVVQELVVELAYLDAAGFRSNKQSAEIARQFCNSLESRKEGFHLNRFLNEVLKSTVGNEKAEHIQTQIQDLLHKRDPFISIRSVDPQTIASILESEHPQAAADHQPEPGPDLPQGPPPAALLSLRRAGPGAGRSRPGADVRTAGRTGAHAAGDRL